MSRSVMIALVAVNAALALGVAGVWLAGSTHWRAPDAVAPDPSMFALPQAANGADHEYSLARVAERPLFAADRRPMAEEKADDSAVAAEEAQEAPVVDNLEGVRLTGLVGSGDGAVAIIDDEDRSRRLAVGQSVRGWRLDAVEGQVAVFADGEGRTRRLALTRSSLFAPDPRAPVVESSATPRAEARSGREARAPGAGESGESVRAERRARRRAGAQQDEGGRAGQRGEQPVQQQNRSDRGQ